MARFVIAVVASKGGTGKTVLSANLAAAIAAQGRSVLAIDCDPQADLTGDLGVSPTEEGGTLADVLIATSEGREAPLSCRYDTPVDGVQLIPGGAPLDDLTTALAAAGSDGEDVLAASLTDDLLEGVDVVIVDTPPQAGPLPIGAMIAADLIVIPCSAQDSRAIGGLLGTVELLTRLRDGGRSHAKYAAVIVRVDQRRFRPRKASRYMVENLTGDDVPFDLPILGQVIEHASVHHSTIANVPVVVSNRDSRVASDYANVATAALAQLEAVAA